jgi:hypothetical protein
MNERNKTKQKNKMHEKLVKLKIIK